MMANFSQPLDPEIFRKEVFFDQLFILIIYIVHSSALDIRQS